MRPQAVWMPSESMHIIKELLDCMIVVGSTIVVAPSIVNNQECSRDCSCEGWNDSGAGKA